MKVEIFVVFFSVIFALYGKYLFSFLLLLGFVLFSILSSEIIKKIFPKVTLDWKNNIHVAKSSVRLIIDNPEALSEDLVRKFFESIEKEVEISFVLKPIDKQKVIENLLTKLHMKEIKLERSKNHARKNEIRRQIGAIKKEIELVSSEPAGFEYFARLSCYSSSDSKHEAAAGAEASVKEIAEKAASILGVRYEFER
ncbi:MAG: hypothetical protein QXL16_00375 [Candidatus Micrarchaeaceae archaeon]